MERLSIVWNAFRSNWRPKTAATLGAGQQSHRKGSQAFLYLVIPIHAQPCMAADVTCDHRDAIGRLAAMPRTAVNASGENLE